ncbi:MAG: carboxypeptidase regulatory-like domain-containing protein [Bryobacteraceae bacterium]
MKSVLFCAGLLVLSAGVAAAQDSRGSIAGKIVDPQDAVIPGVTVVVTNTETGAVSRTATNQTGYFEVNLLNPGPYTVAAETAGFKKSTRSGLELPVAGRLDLTLVLQVGQVTESVEVTAEAPLLDTSTASGGRVIDRRQILELPFADANPFLMSSLAPGMSFTGNPKDTKPYDNGAVSSFNSNGGVGQNEYTIDGAPATGTSRRVGFAPSSDAVEEFKLETTSFDAAYGHTSGANINVVTRAGTNLYHGNLSELHNQQRWNATGHFARLSYEQLVATGQKSPSEAKQGSGRGNEYSGSFGGPVRIPKLIDGRNKLFFFINASGIYTRSSGGKTANVPDPAWNQGDFSALQRVDANKYTVYDPRSARSEGGRVVRTPFPGNRGIPVLNPMAKLYPTLYPTANNPAGLVTAESLNNYLGLTGAGGEDYNALVNRYDYNLNERHRMFGRWFRSKRFSRASDWSYEALPGLHVSGIVRQAKGAGGDYIWTVNSTTTLDFGVNWSAFLEGNQRPVQTGFKPSDAGLPAYLDQKAGDLHQLPRLEFNTLNSISDSYPTLTGRGNTGEAKVTTAVFRGDHSLKLGWQERRYWFASMSPGYSSGRFTFNNTYMRAADNATTASNNGLEYAAFLMGLPSGISLDSNDSGYWSTRYRSLYVQDDWRITSRLRFSLGLRYEREGGITERFNRAIAGGFDFGAKLPFTDAVQAAYAANPLPEVPASQFKVVGGSQYLSPSNRSYTNGTHKLLPRFGVVYQVDSKIVLRGGYGWYYDTYNVNNSRPNQYGYNQPTSTTVSTDNGLSFCCEVGAAGNLAAGRLPVNNPFPVRADGTRFDAPYGNSLGLVAFAGRGLTFTARDFSPAWQQRWRLSVQREIRKDTVVDVSYNGAYSLIGLDQRIDYLPEQYWATGNTRNQAIEDNLTRNVTNPFNVKNLSALQASNPVLYRYLSTISLFSSSTVRKQALLRAYPQMTSLRGVRPGSAFADARGGNRYHDMQIQLEKRYAAGLQMSVMYTRSFAEEQSYRNEFDAAPSWEPNSDVRPHRFVWTSIYELPFSKNRIARGWQLSWIYQYQSGPGLSFGNRFFYGDINKIGDLLRHSQVHGRDIHTWFDPSIVFKGTGAIPAGFTGFEGRSASQPGSYHVRVFPTVIDAVRADGIRNWDVRMLRRFKIRERLAIAFSGDLLNMTNHTNFTAPSTDPTSSSFGKVSGVNGSPRKIQLNLRIDF